jgi:Subtilase family
MRNYLLAPKRNLGRLACLMVLAAALLACGLPQAASAETGIGTGLGASTEPEISLTPSTTKPYTLCPPGGVMIECNIVIEPPAVATPSGYRPPSGGPLLEGGGFEGGWDAENLQSAYKIPTSGGSGETVALVDAYGYSDAESDLKEYRKVNKLSACEKENGCFKKVNEKGEEANYPTEGGTLEKDWSVEQALDVDMVSAACPSCKILLVEATTQNLTDTAASVEEAARLSATEISNSYGYPESAYCPEKTGCSEYRAAYDHPGTPVTVSAGDSGYDNDDGPTPGSPNWPAVSPNVIAVGGTELEKAVNSRGWKEKVWPDSGSGCSRYDPKPSWQTDKGCTKRTDNDVAAVATHISVYNTPGTPAEKEHEHWLNVAGTSVSSPLIAGIEAHATKATKALGADAFYKKPSMLFHISEGSNGECGTAESETWYLCHATKEGYSGPTGWGTPDGVFESTAPVAATGLATKITNTEATLNGIVNPNGTATKYYFEYGTTESYGTRTAEVSVGSGTSNVEESKTITGLAAETTYHFRLVATNSSETTDGIDQVFATAGKPSVTTKAATNVGKSEATLNGVVNPDSLETKYDFEYGTTISYGSKTAEASAGSGTSNVEVSKAITDLEPGMTYHFRIVASNSDGATYGSDQTFTTSSEGPLYRIAGARLTASESKEIKTKTRYSYTLHSGLEWTITCQTQAFATGAKLLGSSGANSGAGEATIEFSGCSVEGNGKGTECSKVSEPLVSKPLKAELVYQGAERTGKLGIDFTPVTEHLFMEIKFPKGCKTEAMKVAGSTDATIYSGEKAVEVGKEPAETTAENVLTWPPLEAYPVWSEEGGKLVKAEPEMTGAGAIFTISGSSTLELEGGSAWGVFT